MYQVSRVDEDGFYIEPVILDNFHIIPNDIIIQNPPDGMIRPKWNGAEWIEGGIVTLDQYKNKAKNTLQRLRDEELNSIFSIELFGQNVLFSYDKVSQGRLLKQGTDIALNPELGTENASTEDMKRIPWKTASHGFISLTRAEFLQVLRAAATHEKTIEFKLLYAQANIDNAITKEEVDAIVESW